MCMSKPKSPKPPPPPPAPPQEAKTTAADEAEVERKKKKISQSAEDETLLTGPNGVDTSSLATSKASLLGS